MTGIGKSTTIRLSWDTYERLKRRKRGGITFDEMIARKFKLKGGRI